MSLFSDVRRDPVPVEARTLLFFARSILPESLAEQAVIVEQAFLKAVEAREDEVAVTLLGEMETARRQTAEKLEWGAPERRDWRWNFALRLMDLFWELPAHPEPPPSTYREDHDRYEIDRREAERQRKGLLQTKLRLLELVGSEWRTEPEDRYLAAYRFFLSVFHAKQHRRMDWETEEAYQRRWNRLGRGEEHKVVEKIFKDRTESFPTSLLEGMIADANLPQELAYHAVTARARKGAVDLAKRDILYAGLLNGLQPDKRSEAALKLHRQLSIQIASRDAQVAELLASMHPKAGHWSSDKIGQSEYVRGEISIQMHSLDTLGVNVICYKGDSLELAQDVFGRARRHVEKFVRETWSGKKVVLEVWQAELTCHVGRYEGTVPEEKD